MVKFGVIDKHGRLRRLTDDDHTQYLNTTRHDLQARHPFTVLPDNLAEIPASFIIFKDGTTYKAKNGSTGAIDYSGTDASTVIQSAINALGTAGGKILVKQGIYEIKSTIIIDTQVGVTLQGEGHGTSVQHGVTIFKQADNTNLSSIVEASARNVILRDFFVDGNKANNPTTDYGINFASEDGSIENVGVMYCMGHGIRISVHAGYFKNIFSEENGSDGFYVDHCWGCIFEDCYSCVNANFGFHLLNGSHYNSFIGCVSQDDVRDGFVLQALPSDSVADLNAFVCCIVFNITNLGRHGFRLLGAQRNSFLGCILYNFARSDDNTYDGFYLAYQGTRNSIKNVIEGCQIFSDTINKHRYGINEVDINQDYNIYMGNVLEGAATAEIRRQGANSIVKFNRGYVTENSGTATGTGAQQTIAHGCAFTPTKGQVIVSNVDDGANPYLSADPDATNIYVTAVNGRQYRWQVEM